MELAIPLIALGGLYIASTKENTNGVSQQSQQKQRSQAFKKHQPMNQIALASCDQVSA